MGRKEGERKGGREQANLFESFYDAFRMLVKHQDGKIERSEFSDTFVEKAEDQKTGVNSKGD